jgi:hypothetical protein
VLSKYPQRQCQLREDYPGTELQRRRQGQFIMENRVLITPADGIEAIELEQTLVKNRNGVFVVESAMSRGSWAAQPVEK